MKKCLNKEGWTLSTVSMRIARKSVKYLLLTRIWN
jgi:hypothetical protein